MDEKFVDIFKNYNQYIYCLSNPCCEDTPYCKRTPANEELFSVLSLQNDMIKSLSKMYLTLGFIDLKENTFAKISAVEFIQEIYDKFQNAQETLNIVVKTLIKEHHKAMVAEFFNLSTLPERIGDRAEIKMDYEGVRSGWCRCHMVPVRRDKDGVVTEVMCYVQRIEDDKLRERKLQFKLEDMWTTYENSDMPMSAMYVDNYELVYANKAARKVCGMPPLEQAIGQKCYQVCRGEKAPCEFCSNDTLKVGQVYKHERYDPKLKAVFHSREQVIMYNGRKIRIEQMVHANMVDETDENSADASEQGLEIIKNAMRLALEERSPDKGLHKLMEYMGYMFKAERTYIFELSSDRKFWNGTYEWCQEGVEPQNMNLQHVPITDTEFWNREFRNGDYIKIVNVEDIKESDRVVYDYLVPQNISSLIVTPIMDSHDLLGFAGLDNPQPGIIRAATDTIQTLGQVIASLIKRRDVGKRLTDMSYIDQMTGLGNRYALERYLYGTDRDKSLGMLLCDLCSLKYVNDNMGHVAGDNYILQVRDILKGRFEERHLFRWGGDEIVVLLSDISKDDFLQQCEALKLDFAENYAPVAFGAVWRSKCPKNLADFVSQADEIMYKNKKEMYEAGYVRDMLAKNPRIAGLV